MTHLDPVKTFAAEVDRYMEPFRGTFAYDTVRRDHLDVSRFYSICQTVARYKAIAGSSVFSSGCGSAGDLFVALEMGAARVDGIEVDDRLLNLALARFRGNARADRVDLRQYDGGQLPYPDSCFDIVLSLHVVEHADRPGLYLKELFRVLRPGGIVYLELPNRWNWVEQHTGLRWVHVLPNPVRDSVVALATGRIGAPHINNVTLSKLRALRSLSHPSPVRLMRMVYRNSAAYRLGVVDAFFHSYGEARLDYRSTGLRNAGKVVFEWKAFRLVVVKKPLS